MKNKFSILAIDPGRYKFGIAVVDGGREILDRGVFTLESLYPTVERMAKEHSVNRIVIGNGTTGTELESLFAKLSIPIEWIDERGSTEEAKALFEQFYPPQGLRKWIPKGLRFPDRDFDDLAAVVIAFRYFNSIKASDD